MADSDKVKIFKRVAMVTIATIVAINLWNFIFHSQEDKIDKAFLNGKKHENQVKNYHSKQVEDRVVDSSKGGDSLMSGSSKSLSVQDDRVAGVVKFKNDSVRGSINLRGARLDDLKLLKYPESLSSDEPHSVLRSNPPDGMKHFLEYGWVSSDGAVEVPNASTIWKYNAKFSDAKKGKMVLEWENSRRVKFFIVYELDDAYMFKVHQIVRNLSDKTVLITPYIRVFKASNPKDKSVMVSHEGFVGNLGGSFHEYKYKKVFKMDDGQKVFSASIDSWIGISDKYWLSAVTPIDYSCKSGTCLRGIALDSYFPERFQARFSTYLDSGLYHNQMDYTYEAKEIKSNASQVFSSNAFVGAKELGILDRYAKEYSIKYFDKAVDLGALYFLTKPVFLLLHEINRFIGNFGISIIILTILFKILLLPLSVKSQISMAKMKALAPKIDSLKKQYSDRKSEYSRQLMRLYSEEGVSPLAGCLPIVLQIPIFFSLYKVLYVTIEMRHAYFFGFIKDLSAADPTTFVNLFGLLPFDPPAFFGIGLLPILMGISMFLQQKVTPHPNASQSQMMLFTVLPIAMTILLSGFATGLLLYWTVSNLLSVAQQIAIDRYVFNTSRVEKQRRRKR